MTGRRRLSPLLLLGFLETSPRLNYSAFLLHQMCAFASPLHVINVQELN